MIAQIHSPPTLTARAFDDPDWLAFLASQPDATVFHHPAWSRVLSDSYGYRACVLVQTDADGAIESGLPTLELRFLGGRRVVALPFTDYCPPLALGPASLARFTRSLVAWHAQTRAGHLSIHGPLAAGPAVNLVARAVRHVLPLRGPSATLLENLRGSPVERGIRKAQRHGVEATVSRSRDDLDAFYRLHLETRRRLGVPVQPKRFLDGLWEHVIQEGLGFIVLARREGRPLAGAIFLAWNGNLIYKFGASDARSWDLRPNNLVIWTAIDWACRNGFRQLDFGRSDVDNQGLRDFKSRWGAPETPLVYSYVGASLPGSTPRLVMRAVAKLIQSSPPIVCRVLGELLYGRVPGFAS